MFLICNAPRNFKGKKILEGLLPPLKIPTYGISLVSAWYNSSLAERGNSLANRALETVFASFDMNGYLSPNKDLGLPMLQLPQIQNREILAVIVLPPGNVIRMALKAFCKIKKKETTKKKLKTPTEEAQISISGIC